MDIPLVVSNHQFAGQTVVAWQRIWKAVCEMSYEGTNIQEEIVTTPGYFQIDDEVMMETGEADQANFYGRRYAINDELLTLDYVWKEYSQKAGAGFTPRIVPEFKHLHIPACLFYTLGVDSWFSECFPNCTVTYWES
jgi:hypothetical protein